MILKLSPLTYLHALRAFIRNDSPKPFILRLRVT